MQQFASVSAISIAPGRMRREFNSAALDELQMSIASKGLLHPIAVRNTGVGLELVAGERRLRVMTRMHEAKIPFFCNGEPVAPGMIPFTFLSELPLLSILEAEFEENVCREGLTWAEQAEARFRLFTIRKKQAEEQGKTYSASQFSEDLTRAGVSDARQRQVIREIAVAKQLEKPGVKSAPSLIDAAKAARKASQSFIESALGDMLEEAPLPKHDLLIGDACLLLRDLPGNTFDCVLTDPPYGIDIDAAGSMVENQHHYNDSAEGLERILDQVPTQLWRITREQAHVYWFCDLRWFAKVCHALEEAGFRTWYRPIIWGKRGKSMAPDIARWPKTTCEFIVYAIKGDRPPLKVADDLILTPYGSDLQQAEKPKELYVELLSRSVMEGQKVIDPFCGSGVIFTSAEELGCSATGIELDEARADFARIRAHGL